MISITTYKIYTIWRSVVEYALVRVMNVELFFDLCCMYVSLFKNQRNYYVNNQKKKNKITRYSENLIFLCRLSNGEKNYNNSTK